MTSRYDDRRIGINSQQQYKEMFKERNVRFINQYFSPNLKFPSVDEIASMEQVGHIWKLGDRFFKLAHKYYGDSTLWWIIAWYNQMPTESHVQIGDVLHVPLPLDQALRSLGL